MEPIIIKQTTLKSTNTTLSLVQYDNDLFKMKLNEKQLSEEPVNFLTICYLYVNTYHNILNTLKYMYGADSEKYQDIQKFFSTFIYDIHFAK